MPKLETVINFDSTSWPYTHSTMPRNIIKDFYGPDTNELFFRNLRYLPDDWIYRSDKVLYNFNDAGLRMNKNISDVNEEFIYFSGTSFTMGIGIAEEKRFGEIVSKETKLDLINYAGPTYSIKLQVLSFFNAVNTNVSPLAVAP